MRHVRPALRQRLESQAVTIIEELYKRFGTEPPQYRREVFFRRGTNDFVLLHRHADRADVLVYLLDTVARRTRAADGRTRAISLVDEALCFTLENSITIIVHPVDVDVHALEEVPAWLRIFQLDLRPPFSIHEMTANSASRIAEERQRMRSPQYQVRERLVAWRKELLGYLQAEFAEQQPHLAADVARIVDDLLANEKSLPRSSQLDGLMLAAAYMKVLPALPAAPAGE